VVADTAWRAGAALFRGGQAATEQTALEAGAPPALARDIAALPEAFPQEAGGAQGVLTRRAAPPLIHDDIEQFKVGQGEAAYMGTAEPAPTTPAGVAETVRQNAEAEKTAPQPTYAPGALGPQPTEAPIQPYAPTRDINAVVRTMAPDTFREYDALEARRDELRSNLAAEAQKLRENAEAQAPNHAEIQDLEQRIESGTTPRLAKKYEERLAALRPAHDAFMESDQFAMLTRDTDEMAQMRQELQQSDYRMRDLAPQVSAAYREAAQQFPVQEEAPAAGAPQPEQVQQAAPPEVAPPVAPEVAPQPAEAQAAPRPLRSGTISV